MICTKVLGKSTEDKFKNRTVDRVDIEWDEAFKKLHHKKSYSGEDVGIRLNETILRRGLRQNDVIFDDGEKLLVVNIPETETIRAHVLEDHPEQIAKLCYEVGNTHTTMFRGEDIYTFYVPYNPVLYEKLGRLHGVEVEKVVKRFEFDDALSNSINNHHH